MKRIIKYIIVGLIGMFIVSDALSQSITHLRIDKCHTSTTGVTTSFYEVRMYQVGQSVGKLINTFSEDGTVYTVPGTGVVNAGSCSGPESNKLSTVEKCHRSTDNVYTSFIDLYSVNSDGTTTLITSLLEDGTVYTKPNTGTFSFGFCVGAGGSNEVEERCIAYTSNEATNVNFPINYSKRYTIALFSSRTNLVGITYYKDGISTLMPLNYPYDASNERHRQNLIDDIRDFFDCKRYTVENIYWDVSLSGGSFNIGRLYIDQPSVLLHQTWSLKNGDLEAPIENVVQKSDVSENATLGNFGTVRHTGVAYYQNDEFLYLFNDWNENIYQQPPGMIFTDCEYECNLDDISQEEYKYETAESLTSWCLTTDIGNARINRSTIWQSNSIDSTLIPHGSFTSVQIPQMTADISYKFSDTTYFESINYKYKYNQNVIIPDSTQICITNMYGVDSIRSRVNDGTYRKWKKTGEKDYMTFSVLRNKLGGINKVISDGGQKSYTYIPPGAEKITITNNTASESNIVANEETQVLKRCVRLQTSTSVSILQVVRYKADNTIEILGTYNIDGSPYTIPSGAIVQEEPCIVPSDYEVIYFCHESPTGVLTSVRGRSLYFNNNGGSGYALELFTGFATPYTIPATGTFRVGQCSPVTEKIEKCFTYNSGADIGKVISFYEIVEYGSNNNINVIKRSSVDGSDFTIPNNGDVTLGYCNDEIIEVCQRVPISCADYFDQDYSIPMADNDNNTSRREYLTGIEMRRSPSNAEISQIIPLRYPYKWPENVFDVVSDLKEWMLCEGIGFSNIVVTNDTLRIINSQIDFTRSFYDDPRTLYSNSFGDAAAQIIKHDVDNVTSSQFYDVTAVYKNRDFSHYVFPFRDPVSGSFLNYTEIASSIVGSCNNCNLDEFTTEKYKMLLNTELNTFCLDRQEYTISNAEINTIDSVTIWKHSEFSPNGTVYQIPTSSWGELGNAVDNIWQAYLNQNDQYGRLSANIDNATNVFFNNLANDGMLSCLTDVPYIDSIKVHYGVTGNRKLANMLLTNVKNEIYFEVTKNRNAGVISVMAEQNNRNLKTIPSGAIPMFENSRKKIIDKQKSGTTIVPGGYSTIMITCESADVTINSLTYPEGYVYNIPIIEGFQYTSPITITGTTYKYTLIR